MTDAERITLELLKAGIWNTDPAGIECSDWESVVKTAHKLSVLPIVSDRIIKLNPGNLSTKTAVRLSNVVFNTVYTSNRLSSAIVEVFDRLEKAGMEPVLLKGHGNAVNYPDPCLRQCGDIDIYVGRDRYEEAGLMFGKEEDSISKIKHTHGTFDGIPIEFHHTSARMLNRRLDRIYLEHEKKYIRHEGCSIMVHGRKIPVPDPTFNGFFLFYHAWNHLVNGGIGIRQFCDIALFIDKNYDKIDKERLKGMIDVTSLMHEWNAVMAVCTDVLGLDKIKAPFFMRSPKWRTRYLMSFILKEGNFGIYRKKAHEKTWLIRKTHELLLLTVRYAKLLPLFPISVLKAYYRFLVCSLFWNLFHINVYKPE